MDTELELLKQENESLRFENEKLKRILKNIKLCFPFEKNPFWSQWQKKLEEFKYNMMQHRCEHEDIDLNFTTLTAFIKILDKLNVPLLNIISNDVNEEKNYFILEWENITVFVDELPITTRKGYLTYSDSQSRKLLKVTDNISFEELALEIISILNQT